MAAEGEYPKVDGDIRYASEVNLNHYRVLEIYTGTDLDFTGTSGAANHELAATTFGTTKPTYIKININAFIEAIAQAGGGNNSKATMTILIESKDIGGSYSTVDTFVIGGEYTDTSSDKVGFQENYLSTLHTLTANEKANGFQVKITATGTSDGSGSTTTAFTNKQIIVEQLS